jgi:hypothetical protein
MAVPAVRASINRPAAVWVGTVLVGSHGDFGRLSADETEKWAKVIKFAAIKVE